MKQLLVKLTSKAAGNKTVKHIRVHKDKIVRRYGLRFISTRAADLRTIKDYRKIVVIRNPLDRLLSAFHDKFFHNSKKRYLKTVRRKLGSRHVNASSLHRLVKAVLYGLRNVHWDSYSRRCNFAGVDYDDVIRVETFQRDIQLFLEYLDMNVSDLSSHNVNRERSKANDLSKVSSMVKPKYLIDYREIPTNDLIRLKQFYANDLRLFGYDFNVDTLVASCSMTDERGVMC